MKPKPLTFLLSLTFLFLFSGSVYGGDFQDGLDAAQRGDFKTAYKLWLPLAEQGDPEAQFNLGLMYSKGEGVLQDYQEALKWFRLAAEQGVAEAQYNLGQNYRKGEDYQEALKWFRLSAEQGYADAQWNLGTGYLRGLGVPQDYKQAVKWYRLSAEQGVAKAQYNLGVMYYTGKGVLQDYVLAHMWLNIAGSNEQKIAIKLRNLVEKKMTPSQIEKAQDMARNWKPTRK